ncbi:5'/3'-nucleotidase SurE [Streptomyces sp. SAI-144]|uniref:5'/3'-nucleotidase SurE n=1 Tax=Streptomyces sp. SAI-144 TaxID=2940544 RepID=UPI002475D736|nr:5'/3'-nucleotidase SurE [Streptomyces sp. SAI-144]MDH6436695.1 5'/3'-nucleotidase SurE [Streptomyces sp. SAI-144]
MTSDDGWRGEGGSGTPYIVALREALVVDGHRVVVVALGTDQSGQGGRVTVPPATLEVARPEGGVWTLTPGSPSDSVYFALDEVLGGKPPDLASRGSIPAPTTERSSRTPAR